MSQEYTQLNAHIKSLLEAERTTGLSTGLTTALKAVRLGQYVPGDKSAKPVLYFRPYRTYHMADLSGAQIRSTRLLYWFSMAVLAGDQEAAVTQGCNLYNNLENFLMNHAAESGYWGGSHFGPSYSTDDESGMMYGQIDIEPLQGGGCIAHSYLLWSIDIRVGAEP